MLPILVLRDLDLGAAGLGTMMSCGAVGGLAGALATPWLVLGQTIGLLPTMWIGVAGGVLGCVFVVFSPLLGMRTLPDAEEVHA